MTLWKILALVALVPLLAVLLWRTVGPALRRKFEELDQSAAAVSRMRELTHDFSMLRSTILALVGYKFSDGIVVAFSVAWFVAFYALANRFAEREVELANDSAEEAEARQLKTMRSIAYTVVRSEARRRSGRS